MSNSLPKEWLASRPEYVEILSSVLEYEDNNKDPESHYLEDTDHDSYWDYSDIGAMPQKLYQLEVKGLIEKVFDSNSQTYYVLKNREKVRGLVEELENKYGDGTREVMHDFPSESGLDEMGVFDDVIGHEDVKFLMRRAMSSEDIVNILLLGPPGSAKTVFLMCINKLDKSVYVSGKPTTGPGFMDKMFSETPRYMAIDELDQMEKSHQEILSEYTETGMLVEAKGNNKQREMKTNTKTFAAANHEDQILDNIKDRFVDIHFEPYNREEFIEVCIHILPRNEGKGEDEAKEIAHAVWEMEGFGNVRKAIQASRLSRGDPKKVLSVLEDYSGRGAVSF